MCQGILERLEDLLLISGMGELFAYTLKVYCSEVKGFDSLCFLNIQLNDKPLLVAVIQLEAGY